MCLVLVIVQVNVLSALNCFNAKFIQLSVNNPQERLTLKQQREMTSEMKKDDSMATEAHLAPGHKNHGMSVLQQYVAYFDKNDDGIVYPWETYAGFRAIGLNVIVSAILAFAFNLINSYPSLPGWIPSLLLPVYIVNIHKAKHGSDPGVYDKEGRFVPVNLENMFSKYAKTHPEKMTYRELWNMTEGNGVAYDLVGWIESKASWTIFYLMTKDKDGFVSKENARSLFDGSLFEKLAKNCQT
ncbi:putative peroxygenase 3 isoform X2 [Apium graveolens]|uniref:putative peroxygenase 3 isoform X2 n=1 Tax=Apium graveolens TaxID=4045 RepID=UPI003D7ACBF5